MPNPWMPGLRHDPGRSAGYNAGENRMYMAVDHDTGGTNSYNVCKWGRPGYNAGLCQILLPKVGVPWQFCEIDAICYHAGSAQYGNYNDDGPGFEIERLQGEPPSPDQIHWMGRIIHWCDAEWSIPALHYWGPQFPWRQANFHGHVNHRDIHPNPDGLSSAEWAACTGSGPAPEPTTRRVNQKMWMAAILDKKWCDVYYNGVLVDAFPNDGPLGIGTQMRRYIDGGAAYTIYKTEADYNSVRTRLLKASTS
jgi:N-acetylmuramoyl-L-alanine amidase